jgi:murein DD-endopeptidase MepM/ murein hydrolase activator NlpD
MPVSWQRDVSGFRGLLESRVNIVVFSKRWARARHIELGHPLVLGALVLCGGMLLGGAFLAGVHFSTSQPVPVVSSGPDLEQQQAQIHSMRVQLNEQLADLAARVGQVNAQMLRLNALGKRLTEMAHLDKGEFNFDAPPAQGGPESEPTLDVNSDMSQSTAAAGLLGDTLEKLQAQLIDRERQMVILETFITARQLTKLAVPSGTPLFESYISSEFGRRTDPFTGELAFHPGIDLAASEGALVHSVAPGVVTWAGERAGYGKLVEINHGNGYITRYAHNSRVLVHVGDKVKKGQNVSQVGSTGRSTGPHLHFEVIKNGQTVNPISYLGG